MMKKRVVTFLLVMSMGIALAACGGKGDNNKPETTPPTEQGEQGEQGSNNNNNGSEGEEKPTTEPEQTDNEGTDNAVNSSSSPKEMVDAILDTIEQPAMIDIEADMLKDMYHFDPTIAEQYTVKLPMMNVKTNEIAIFQLKDAASFSTLEEGLKERAADVQKQFESYLQDQYENAKEFKIVQHENYVLFVISESADKIVEQFNSFFAS